MFSKVLVKEMDGLKETLIKLREDISDTMQKTTSVDEQYVRAKEEHESQMLSLAKIISNQQKRLDDLGDEEADLDIKLNSLDDLILEQQASTREDTDELQKARNENAEEEEMTKKTMESLSKSIQRTRLELECDEEYLTNLEESFETGKVVRARELAEKLEKIRLMHSVRMKAAEDRYNAKMEPLMYRIKCLDEDIEKVESEIMTKPKEEAALKRRHDMLEEKRARAAMARLFSEFDLTMEGIEKALDFFLRNSNVANVDDVELGVALAKSNFRWISNRIRARFGPDHVINEKLSAVMKMTDEILKIKNRTNIYPFLIQELSKTEAKDIVYGSLVPEHADSPDYPTIRFDSCQSIQSYLMTGTPKNSDKCLSELYSSDCESASEECWFSEANNKIHSGYKTSHRLIYFLAASKLNCDKKNGRKFSDINEKKEKLCRQMLREAKVLQHYTEFIAVQDLFMEQIALCGFEGFGEFGLETWRNKVRSWQSKRGCFGHNTFPVRCSTVAENLGSNRVKRADSTVEGCHSHVTAVAVAAMAFHLRFIFNSAILVTPIFL